VSRFTRIAGREASPSVAPARTQKALSLTSFHDFGLNDAITRALTEEKYLTPTPIQAQTIPTVTSGRDVIGIAQTGTGKTAAFALPILHHLAANPRPRLRKSCRVLVISPTRELSGQILDSFRIYGRHLRISAALTIGGVPMGKQVRSLADGVDILVATPGRLLDLVKSNALRLGEVECLVLDEADRMLDMGFIHDIRKIVAKLPTNRQTLMFSATMPRAIAELAAQMLRDPVKVAVTPTATTAERIDQRLIRVDRAAKPVLWFLRAPSTAPTRSFAGWSAPASQPKRSTATNRKASANACLRRFAKARSGRWSPLTLPHAASMSTA
jgi:ATP-dependent RNA helicase RhlE